MGVGYRVQEDKTMNQSKTYEQARLEHFEQVAEGRRKTISTMKLIFLGGTDITSACETMFHLQQESNAEVIGYFNDVRIHMDNADTHKRIHGEDR